MKISIGTKEKQEEWHNWFAWYPVYESENYGIKIFWLETIQRKWVPSKGYGHYGNYTYK